MRYEFRKQNIELFEFELSNSNYAYYISPPLIKNRFKISGYCFLLIIPPIFTPLFLTRMNCFDHLNKLRSSLFFIKMFSSKDFMGSTVLLLSLLSSWWYGRFCYIQLRKCVFLILLSFFMLLRLMRLFTSQLQQVTMHWEFIIQLIIFIESTAWHNKSTYVKETPNLHFLV